MSNKNINGPEYMEIDPKPSGIQKIRRLPFLIFTLLFVGIVVFQIFNISNKQEHQQRVKKESIEKGAVSHIGQIQAEHWFEKKKYDDIRFASPDGHEIKAGKDEPIPFSVEGKKETVKKDDAFNEESQKAEMELYRLKQSEELEKQKAYYNALKSPGQIARFKNSRITNAQQTSSTLSSGVNNGVNSSESLLSRLSEGVSDGDLNRQSDKTRFLKSGVLPGNYLPHLKQQALSPYEIKAGTLIPSALITGLNSDLPGYVTAQVRENVYDTVTGNYLLIPQGSKIIGEYDSNITFGQNRALVVWTRLLFPDGSSVNLEKMQGVDISGYAGFKDKVNHHYFRIYSNALLLSLVGAGYELLSPGANNEDPVQSVAANIGQQLAQTASEVTRKNIDIQPTIIIRPGFKFNIYVLKDMVLDEVTFNEL